MRCPFCGHSEDKVVDSRGTKEGDAIRRRRQCLKCSRRFTTYEQIEHSMPQIRKKDGRWEPFDRNKLMGGLIKACQKRPVSQAALESATEEIEKECFNRNGREVTSDMIGSMVMERLRSLDPVAYVRFASVYREFKDVTQFSEIMEELMKRGAGKSGPGGVSAAPVASEAGARRVSLASGGGRETKTVKEG
jgi:transcriptional repressor NrdR